MPTFSELISSFAFSHSSQDLGGEVQESNSGYRTEGHILVEIVDHSSREVAGWQDPGGIDAMIWISNGWTGWQRTNLELKLKQIPMVCYTVMPTDDYDDLGADVTWWGFAVECMSCSDKLTDPQRTVGLCDDCHALRANHLEPDSPERWGTEQRKGLHGEPLPRSRPNRG